MAGLPAVVGLPAVIRPHDDLLLPGVVGQPGAVGCPLSLVSMGILFIVVNLLSVGTVPTWPVCVSWVLEIAARLGFFGLGFDLGVFSNKTENCCIINL